MILVSLLLLALQSSQPLRDTLTDDDLVALDAAPIDRKVECGQTIIIGIHHGAEVVAQYSCGEICAVDHRTIRYNAEVGRECDVIGGVVQKKTSIVCGAAKRMENTWAYCVPKILKKPDT